jgi:hypothetical protein
MVNASTVAKACTVETPSETKQTQANFIYADQILGSAAVIRRNLIWFFSVQVNL